MVQFHLCFFPFDDTSGFFDIFEIYVSLFLNKLQFLCFFRVQGVFVFFRVQGVFVFFRVQGDKTYTDCHACTDFSCRISTLAFVSLVFG